MLSVTGQRSRNKATTPVPAATPIVDFTMLADPDSVVNNKESGKRAGSTVYVWDTGNDKYSQYIASGSSPHAEWKPVGGGDKGISMEDTSHVIDKYAQVNGNIEQSHIAANNNLIGSTNWAVNAWPCKIVGKDEEATGNYVRVGRTTTIYAAGSGTILVTPQEGHKLLMPNGNLATSYTIPAKSYIKMTPDKVDGSLVWVVTQTGNQ